MNKWKVLGMGMAACFPIFALVLFRDTRVKSPVPLNLPDNYNRTVVESARAIDMKQVAGVRFMFYGPSPYHELQFATVIDPAMIRRIHEALLKSRRTDKVNDHFLLAEAKMEDLTFLDREAYPLESFRFTFHEVADEHGPELAQIVTEVAKMPRQSLIPRGPRR